MIRAWMPIPPPLHSLFPTSGKNRVKSARYKQWSEEAGWLVMAQGVVQQARSYGIDLTKPMVFRLELHFTDNRRRDASNYVKAPEDLLAQILGYDDNLNHEVRVRKHVKQPEAWCEVLIGNLENTGERRYTIDQFSKPQKGDA